MPWELRMPQFYRPSLPAWRKQQWICCIYRSAACSFSKSSGAVRYIPKGVKQSCPQRQGKSADSRLNQSIGDAEPSIDIRRLPSEVHECRQTAEASGFWVHERNNTDFPYNSESIKLQSVDVPEVQRISNVPVSLTDSFARRRLSDTSPRASKDGKEIAIQPAYARLQTIANGKSDSAEPFSGDFACLGMHVVRTNAGQTGNRDKEGTEEKEGVCPSLNSERKSCSQWSEGSSRSALSNAHSVSEEAFVQGRRPQLWKDAESFLLKIQKSKENSPVPVEMQPTVATGDSNTDAFDGTANKKEYLENTRNTCEGPHFIDSYSTAEHEHAKNQAIRCLAMRPFTAAELRKKLIGRNIVPSLADYAVAKVQNCGLQNDMAYAETFSSSRFDHGGWGPEKIRQGLRRRGVREEIIKAAIDKVFHEEKGDNEPDKAQEEDDVLGSKGIDISKTAMDHLLIQATKKWNQGKNATIETKTRRMICWLQYRGFSYSVIKHVLSQLRKGLHVDH